MRVLLVEDHADFRDLLRAALERRGFAVETCAQVRDALVALASGIFDVLLTDATLDEPEDGLELIRSATELGLARRVVLTGSHDVEARARAAGAHRVLMKPVLTSKIVAALTGRPETDVEE
jgi:DNA-binding response OmpR family regulator